MGHFLVWGRVVSGFGYVCISFFTMDALELGIFHLCFVFLYPWGFLMSSLTVLLPNHGALKSEMTNQGFTVSILTLRKRTNNLRSLSFHSKDDDLPSNRRGNINLFLA